MNTLLWEVSGNGLKAPTYVFGTMHVLCAEDAQLSDSLKTIIHKVNEVYFEIDMDNIMQMMGMLQHVNMKGGVKLSDLLTVDEYKKLETYLKAKSPLPLSMMTRFKPFFISGLITESGLDCKEKDGMESAIMKEAKAHDKVINGLETVAYQAGIFDSIPYKDQARELMRYVDSGSYYLDQTMALVSVYKKQDLDEIEKMTVQSDPGTSNYLDLLLFNRNKNWVKKLQELMPKGSYLIAVGAGHLPGKQGVLQLLRNAGYTVRPIPNIVKSGIEANP
ncbi:MAG: TraB/GumN family protein [Chitinophagaceae bacterium]|nr:TraB/GumN family protein [Chitinophagaceae bacterium]